MKVAPEVKAKDPKQYKIVGQSVKRVELPAKVTGEHDYIHDVRIPGMLHGRVVRPPVINTEPISIDHDSIKGIPGVVMIVREGKFVGVVAKTEWAAIKAAQALKVTWSKPTSKVPANPEELYTYLKNTKPARTHEARRQRQRRRRRLSQAKKTYQATYRWPFQMHGMIGPSCSIADVKGDKATIWSGPQGPFGTRRTVATLAADSRAERAHHLSRSVGFLRPHEHRRRRRRRGVAFPRGRSPGARAVVAPR